MLVGTALAGPAADRGTLSLIGDTEAASSTITADVLNSPPNLRCTGGLLVCQAGLSARPVLTWDQTPDTYATGYTVHRSTTSGSGYTQVGSVAGRATTTWTDTTPDLAVGVTYYYVVRSVAAVWRSTNSNQVTVTIVLGL